MHENVSADQLEARGFWLVYLLTPEFTQLFAHPGTSVKPSVRITLKSLFSHSEGPGFSYSVVLKHPSASGY